MTCSKCNSPVAANDPFCKNCGQLINTSTTAPTAENKKAKVISVASFEQNKAAFNHKTASFLVQLTGFEGADANLKINFKDISDKKSYSFYAHPCILSAGLKNGGLYILNCFLDVQNDKTTFIVTDVITVVPKKDANGKTTIQPTNTSVVEGAKQAVEKANAPKVEVAKPQIPTATIQPKVAPPQPAAVSAFAPKADTPKPQIPTATIQPKVAPPQPAAVSAFAPKTDAAKPQIPTATIQPKVAPPQPAAVSAFAPKAVAAKPQIPTATIQPKVAPPQPAAVSAFAPKADTPKPQIPTATIQPKVAPPQPAAVSAFAPKANVAKSQTATSTNSAAPQPVKIEPAANTVKTSVSGVKPAFTIPNSSANMPAYYTPASEFTKNNTETPASNKQDKKEQQPQQSSAPQQPKQRKKGCGCLVLIVIILVAVVFFGKSSSNTHKSASKSNKDTSNSIYYEYTAEDFYVNDNLTYSEFLSNPQKYTDETLTFSGIVVSVETMDSYAIIREEHSRHLIYLTFDIAHMWLTDIPVGSTVTATGVFNGGINTGGEKLEIYNSDLQLYIKHISVDVTTAEPTIFDGVVTDILNYSETSTLYFQHRNFGGGNVNFAVKAVMPTSAVDGIKIGDEIYVRCTSYTITPIESSTMLNLEIHDGYFK